MLRKLPLLLGLCGLFGCSHPVDIDGSGDLISTTGTRDCSKEAAPCIFLVAGPYQETYIAMPRPGSRFSHWRNCPTVDGGRCRYSIPAQVVRDYWGETVDPLIAVFTEEDHPGELSSAEAALFLQRSTFGPTLARWYGAFPDSTLAEIFPNLGNFAATDLGFLTS